MTIMNHAIFTFIILVLSSFASLPAANTPVSLPPNETTVQRDSRLAWWHEAKFGMFIHWGLYSQLAGEWKGGYYSGIGGRRAAVQSGEVRRRGLGATGAGRRDEVSHPHLEAP